MLSSPCMEPLSCSVAIYRRHEGNRQFFDKEENEDESFEESDSAGGWTRQIRRNVVVEKKFARNKRQQRGSADASEFGILCIADGSHMEPLNRTLAFGLAANPPVQCTQCGSYMCSFMISPLFRPAIKPVGVDVASP